MDPAGQPKTPRNEVELQIDPERWQELKNGSLQISMMIVEEIQYAIEVLEILECPMLKVRMTPLCSLQ